MSEPPHPSEHESLRAVLEEEKQEFAVPASRGSRLAMAVRALRHRNFQLFFAGQLDLACRHVDADCRAVLAGLSHDRLCSAAGNGGIRQPDSGFHHGANRRHRGRPQEPPPRGNRHPSRLHDPGRNSRRSDAQRPDPGLANHGARGGTRRGQRLRHSRPAGVPHRHGWARRPAQRHRVELDHVQRRAHYRAGDRRHHGGVHRRRLVLLRQRRQLYRGHRRAAADEDPACRQPCQPGDLHWSTSWKDFASCATPVRSA